ncbi:cytochrome c family protein [Pseudoroseomonas cervicalis]|uniref:c-type cytochrome n=1 Tax=Teichococcus cervicalis TaxID=204525 RepID=UPI00277FE037|nr:c-type cytochrome [Pseudoroseomonas cervicalis]MDQ1077607.1 cytochrome c1 [Pseudoroseomonas cervicalis]
MARPRRLGWALAALLLAAGGLAWPLYAARQERIGIARAITGGEPSRAPPLLIRHGCGGCHSIPGVPGADGRVAAPLDGLRQRVYLGGVLPNTAENLMAWITDPRRFAPNTAMPANALREAEARDIAAFLYSR